MVPQFLIPLDCTKKITDSNKAPDAFATFIPISIASGARTKIIFDFFEILAAIAAHGKANGLAGRKLSRYAGWWAFEFVDTGSGFEGGYRTWAQYAASINKTWNFLTYCRAADATSHLFFAYLRSLSPESAHGKGSILNLPLSLQQLLETTEYPPVPQEALQSSTSKVVMIVETVSPTPFALLRRAKNFHYREQDQVLRRFSDYDDPVSALTEECRRVLKSIATANESTNAKTSTSLLDPSWSRFEDIGFSGFSTAFENADDPEASALGKKQPMRKIQGLRTTPASGTADLGRPTTPSWADFLSSGFHADQSNTSPTHLLPPDKVLPPIVINERSATSQSHRRNRDDDSTLEPGELASITAFALDDTFWWVWMTSLAGEETPARKAAFGRCALVETNFSRQWLVMEEIIKGAAPDPEEGAYIAEKKSRSFFSRKSKLSRSKSSGKGTLPKADAVGRNKMVSPASKTSIAPDQQARIQAAAAALQEKKRAQHEKLPTSPRRARHNDDMSIKTNSVLTLQPMIMSEAAPAMKWANTYDKNEIRAKYLGDNFAGRGSNISLLNDGPGASNTSLSQAPRANVPGVTAREAPMEAPQPPAPSANKENVVSSSTRKPGSPTARDEKKAYPKRDPALVEVLNKGPPDSSSIPRKPPSQQQQIPRREQAQQQPAPTTAPPPVPNKDQAATVPAEVPPAAIPLPGETPLPATPTKEYPLPAAGAQQPPADRTPVPPQKEAPPPPAKEDKSKANGRAVQSPPSPESPKHNKLKKKNAPGGFKGLFGRKKEQDPVKAPPRTSSNNASAVAAARAALEAKAAQNQKPPEAPTAKVTSKRFSTLGRKKENESPTELKKETKPIPEERLDEHPAYAPPAPPQAPFAEAERSHSIATNSEEQRAEREFRTFDQGPLEDAPAFVPSDTPTDRHDSQVSAEPTDHYTDDEPLTKDVSRASMVEDEEDADGANQVTANDRWAQIRKNAAERAAARQSEEQSRRTDRTDDDGDTSGEESKLPQLFTSQRVTNPASAIESRVARIKARVAELTGNMDLPNRS